MTFNIYYKLVFSLFCRVFLDFVKSEGFSGIKTEAKSVLGVTTLTLISI